MGEATFAFEMTDFDVSNLENGIYILAIKKNGSLIHTEKILIQH